VYLTQPGPADTGEVTHTPFLSPSRLTSRQPLYISLIIKKLQNFEKTFSQRFYFSEFLFNLSSTSVRFIPLD
jgi:hypothetical protein